MLARLALVVAVAALAAVLPASVALSGVTAPTVQVTLAPATLKADGKTWSIATARVRDAAGNPVSNANVTFSSDGGQAIGPVTNHNNGSYTARVTSTKQLGDSTLTATYDLVADDVTGEATLTQARRSGNCVLATDVITCTYGQVDAEQGFVVPAGISAVDITAVGGFGGAYYTKRPGYGGRVSVDGLSVTPGQMLYVEVGGNGGWPGNGHGCEDFSGGWGGWNGGGNGGRSAYYSGGAGCLNMGSGLPGVSDLPGWGGGGASDVRTHSRDVPADQPTGVPGTDPRLLVAGGGGGAAWYGAARGGDGGVPSEIPAADGDGEDGTVPIYEDGEAGEGGKRGRGGAAGLANPGQFEPPTAGSAGQGGRGAGAPTGILTQASGGGGGGWFGGGGGTGRVMNNSGVGSGGGGGSSWVPEGGTIHGADGAPRVVISYTADDTTAPQIGISAPHDGARFALGERVEAAYACEDEIDGMGVQSCTGTVEPGQPIDTATAGRHEFTVTARDVAGNVRTMTVHYTVDAAPTPAPPAGGPANTIPSGTGDSRERGGPLRILRASIRRDGTILATVQVPNAGTVIGLATFGGKGAHAAGLRIGKGRIRWAQRRSTVSGGGVVQLRLTPTAKARRILRRSKGRATVRLTVAFGELPHNLVRKVRVLRLK